MYYDKDGSPLELMEWAKKFEAPDYKRIAKTTLPDGKWVSTVWLGLNHSWGIDPPLIFETMVFSSEENLRDLATLRYATLKEAEDGHNEVVARFSNV